MYQCLWNQVRDRILRNTSDRLLVVFAARNICPIGNHLHIELT